MDVERVFFQGIAFAPHLIQHLLAGEQAIGEFQELPENLKLFRRQFNQAPADSHFMPVQIHSDLPDVIVHIRCGLRHSPAKNRPDPGQQFAGALTAHDEIDIPFVILDTLIVCAGSDGDLHGNDRRRSHGAKLAKVRLGGELAIDDDQRRAGLSHSCDYGAFRTHRRALKSARIEGPFDRLRERFRPHEDQDGIARALY